MGSRLLQELLEWLMLNFINRDGAERRLRTREARGECGDETERLFLYKKCYEKCTDRYWVEEES